MAGKKLTGDTGAGAGAGASGAGMDTSLWPAMTVKLVELAKLIPYARNSRTHSNEQIAQIAASIKEWGFTNPILQDETGTIIAGHGRALAAERLGLAQVPVASARGWTKGQIQAYVIADNKLAENAGWDKDALKIELADLGENGFDIALIGFSDDDLSALLGDGVDIGPQSSDEDGGVRGDFLKFGKSKVAIAEDELAGLEALKARYANEFGLTHGFARWLIEGQHVG